MRSQIAQFLRANRDKIRGMIHEADLKTKEMPDSIFELGYLISEDMRLSARNFAQRYVQDSSSYNGYRHFNEYPYAGYVQVWDAEPGFHWGNIHTHPNQEGQDKLSWGDQVVLDGPQVGMVMVATRAGDGRFKVIANWEADGKVEKERFDLYPLPTWIARFLAKVLHLPTFQYDWQLILADYDGDGKITIKDAMRAAQEGR